MNAMETSPVQSLKEFGKVLVGYCGEDGQINMTAHLDSVEGDMIRFKVSLEEPMNESKSVKTMKKFFLEGLAKCGLLEGISYFEVNSFNFANYIGTTTKNIYIEADIIGVLKK